MVVGGAKVADKIGVLRSLIPKSDIVVVGGRMAFTFLAAMGVSVGNTQIEAARLEDARSIIELSKAHGVKLYLPVDASVSESLDEPLNMTVTDFSTTCCTDISPCVSPGWYGIDVGPKSEVIFANALSKAKTIFLNGPMVSLDYSLYLVKSRVIQLGKETVVYAVLYLYPGVCAPQADHCLHSLHLRLCHFCLVPLLGRWPFLGGGPRGAADDGPAASSKPLRLWHAW